MIDDLRLPDFHVPEKESKRIPPEVYEEWVTENARLFKTANLKKKNRPELSYRPVEVRFKLI